MSSRDKNLPESRIQAKQMNDINELCEQQSLSA